jgi:uncharacterized DUF497 family protein
MDEFEWDENKRRTNLQKHGLDFIGAKAIFDGPHIKIAGKTVGAELRQIAIGRMGGRTITVVYTMRGPIIRLISMRRARHEERGYYEALYGRGDGSPSRH